MKLRNLMSGLLALTLPLQSLAAASDDALEQLRAELAALSQRLNALESENAQLRETSMTTVKEIAVNREQVARIAQDKSAASWTDTIKLKGDFRYRFENIDEEGKDDRDRNRIRARAELQASLPDNVKVGLGVATGGDDPVSTNQTLGGGGSSKDLRLDLAYANWAVTEELSLVGGKFKNVFYRPQKHGLIWDGDFNPEGFGATYKKDWFFANAAGTWLESDTKGGDDSFTWGAQAGFKTDLAGVSITAGASYFALDTAGKGTVFGDDDEFFGNSFVCSDPADTSSCTYAYDYNEIEFFADVSTTIGGVPTSAFVDYVTNDDADENDTGWAAGISVAPGDWKLAYVYQDLEADAVFGLVSDSDFGGGGTDVRGHIFKGGYSVNKKWSLSVSYFLNEIGEDRGNKHDYDRIQIDTQFKY